MFTHLRHHFSNSCCQKQQSDWSHVLSNHPWETLNFIKTARCTTFELIIMTDLIILCENQQIFIGRKKERSHLSRPSPRPDWTMAKQWRFRRTFFHYGNTLRRPKSPCHLDQKDVNVIANVITHAETIMDNPAPNVLKDNKGTPRPQNWKIRHVGIRPKCKSNVKGLIFL